MIDFFTILKKHMEIYPRMQLQDAVKLLYQHHFGAGHMIANGEDSLKRLVAEWETTPKGQPRVEDIGGGRVRLYLCGLEKEELEAVNLAFVQGAVQSEAESEAFHADLRQLGRLFGDEKYIAECIRQGCPAVSHSDIFRNSYAPAYRVMEKTWLRLVPVITKIQQAVNSGKKPVLTVLEGRAASGKTTLAALISRLYNAPVIHMDDFFLPAQLRTPERFETPGGNIYFERFCSEVVEPLERGVPLHYRRFDCSTMSPGDTVDIPVSDIYIVEGAYSMHPAFSWQPDVSVFTEVGEEAQMQRIISRNGERMYNIFKEQWIPMEEKYFETFQIKGKCTVVI